MLSLKECRRILGPDCRLSEEQLKELRDQLHGLAVLTVDACLEHRSDRVAEPTSGDYSGDDNVMGEERVLRGG